MNSTSRHAFGILVLIVGLFLAPLARADDLVISRAVLEDPAGTLTIADVAGRAFEPVGPVLSKGLTKSAFWLRVQVRAPEKGGAAVLYIRQTYLNDIRLYEAAGGDPLGWKSRATGNHHAYEEHEGARISLRFAVNVTAPQATYYLRLKTASPLYMRVEALTPEDAERADDQLDLLEVFFVTSMLALLIWVVHSYAVDRQPVVGLFALHQAVYILFGIAITGYLTPYYPVGFPQLVAAMTAVPYCGIAFTGLLFCRALFRPYEPPPLLMRGLDLLLLVFPLQLVAMALGHFVFAVAANAVLLRVSWWYFVVVAFSLRREQAPSRRVLQAFFVTIALATTGYWLSKHSDANVLNGWQILIFDGLIIGSLFAMMLHTRSRRLQHEGQQAALDLLVAQRTLEIERALKEEAELRARTDHLTGLFNRRHFIELGERELARAMRYRRPLSLLMVDIDHFKSINDTWGHSAGDVVLQEVSHLIRNALRDVDIVGRLGGEEFAAVLVETDGRHALQVAERLCATVAATVIAPRAGMSVKVTISLGITDLNGRTLDFDSLLREADLALYQAKQSGRNKAVGCG